MALATKMAMKNRAAAGTSSAGSFDTIFAKSLRAFRVNRDDASKKALFGVMDGFIHAKNKLDSALLIQSKPGHVRLNSSKHFLLRENSLFKIVMEDSLVYDIFEEYAQKAGIVFFFDFSDLIVRQPTGQLVFRDDFIAGLSLQGKYQIGRQSPYIQVFGNSQFIGNSELFTVFNLIMDYIDKDSRKTFGYDWFLSQQKGLFSKIWEALTNLKITSNEESYDNKEIDKALKSIDKLLAHSVDANNSLAIFRAVVDSCPVLDVKQLQSYMGSNTSIADFFVRIKNAQKMAHIDFFTQAYNQRNTILSDYALIELLGYNKYIDEATIQASSLFESRRRAVVQDWTDGSGRYQKFLKVIGHMGRASRLGDAFFSQSNEDFVFVKTHIEDADSIDYKLLKKLYETHNAINDFNTRGHLNSKFGVNSGSEDIFEVVYELSETQRTWVDQLRLEGPFYALGAKMFRKMVLKYKEMLDQDEQMNDSQKVIYCYYRSMDLLHNPYSQGLDHATLVDKSKQRIRGWFDLAKYFESNAAAQWAVWIMRSMYEQNQSSLELFAEIFYQISFCVMAMNLGAIPNSFMRFNPFDRRGGFNAENFKKVTETILPFKMREFLYDATSSRMAILQSVANLVYLAGSDFGSLQGKLVQKNKDCEQLIHSLGANLHIPVMTAEKISKWRPYLNKFPEIIQKIHIIMGLEWEPDHENYTKNDLFSKLVSSKYPGVPPELVMHTFHADANGWSNDIMQSFIQIAMQQRKPRNRIANPTNNRLLVTAGGRNTVVRHLDAHDPMALYIGELSGCCQHINYGAGRHAAIQSYTEDWCGVLAIESENKTLLAQAFLWIDEYERVEDDQRTIVVIDSLESVFDDNDAIVSQSLAPATLAWSRDMIENQNYRVFISGTGYGITQAVRQLLEQGNEVTLKSVRRPRKAEDLRYTDCRGDVYEILLNKTNS